VISAPQHPQNAAITDLMRIDAGRFGADTSDEASPTRVLNRSVKEGLATTRESIVRGPVWIDYDLLKNVW
jgi:hypothetical protein